MENLQTLAILEAFVNGTRFCVGARMFSIAIYDQQEDKLFLFRDRMGIKPLFYSLKDDEFIFAGWNSEVGELKNEPINYDSVYSYLHLGYIPSNKTIYKNILKVKPGHTLNTAMMKLMKQYTGI